MLSLNMLFVWLILLIVCIVIELLTMGLTTIWFAAGSLVAALAAALQAPTGVQVVLFLVVSIVLLFFTRPVAVKYFNNDRIRTNVESLIGRQAIVVSEISNIEGIGQVSVGGQEWTARSKEDGVTIPVGTVIIICAINGVKLIVEPK
ncbi:MAG TPA: NfeD family protein [Lachnospiraceae bacterium]|nr:NfeD family protein [Lachnospiraceae bacterium]